jgi:nucleoside-diphosphate-sugar epimerase
VDIVTESTECHPGDAYEATKLALERYLLGQSEEALQIAVLRPTAVFGPRGRNLLKLANDLERRPAALNYLKSCLQGVRRMNLVCVKNVVAALTFLVTTHACIAAEAFIVSDDEYPINNYQEVERRLRLGLGIGEYLFRPIALPPRLLSLALRATGRTNANPLRVYDSSKIRDRGFRKPVTFEQGLAEFIDWYREQGRRQRS